MISRLPNLTMGRAFWLGAVFWADAVHADSVWVKVGEEIVLATYLRDPPRELCGIEIPLGAYHA
jgi:hypothetical protein